MQLDLDKINKKRWYKFRGVVIRTEFINPYISKIYCSKGTGAKKKIFIFTSKSAKINYDISDLTKNYRIKVWFTIECVQFNNKWFTNLIIQDYEYWQVNEKKIALLKQQTSLLDDKEYISKIAPQPE